MSAPVPDNATHVTVTLMGENTEARDPFEVTARLYAIPRVGEQVCIWDGSGEVYLTVQEVIWPTWRYDHDPDRSPRVLLRREGGMTDAEWEDAFEAVKEDRRP